MEKLEQSWCYNCGKPFTESNTKTVEHVPMKALFAEKSDDYKRNIVTVKGCFQCNNEYSKLDSEFRDFVSVAIDDNALSAKMARGLKRSKSFEKKISFSKDGMFMEFDLNNLDQIHRKHMKALFYYVYSIPFPKDWNISIANNYGERSDINSYHTLKRYVLPILDEKNIEWRISGHKDIFYYRIKTIRPMEYVDDFQLDVTDLKKGDYIICEIKYFKNIHTIMLAELR